MTKKQIMAAIDADCVKTSKLIARNTVEYVTNDGTKVIRFYETNIIVFHTDGTIELNTDGYFTKTTKERINRFSPFHIYRYKGAWLIDNVLFPVNAGIRLKAL